MVTKFSSEDFKLKSLIQIKHNCFNVDYYCELH